MPLFNKILVAYDGSEFSDKAMEMAVELAKVMGLKEVILLHIVQEIPRTNTGFYIRVKSSKTGEEVALSVLLKEIYQEMKSKMLKRIEKKEIEIRDKGVKIKINPHIKVGLPVDQIVEFVDEENVDLIIMGSKGIPGISRLIKGLGSISRTVSEKVKCPVLIVR